MGKINFAANLFLEKEELNRWNKFLTEEGFAFDVKYATAEFGIIHNPTFDPNFDFFRVSLGANGVGIKVNPGFAYDSDRLLITQKPTATDILVNEVDVWKWVRIRHKYSSVEEGTISIGGSNKGLMTGTKTKFNEVLRKQPNFAAKIRFVNSNYYKGEYEVLDVLSNGAAVLQGSFDYVENNLQYVVVGTFTRGYYPPENDKQPFRYDDCQVDLIGEDATGNPPALNEGKEFYIAKVRLTSGGLDIIDYRFSCLHRTLLQDQLNTVSQSNNLIGIKAVQKIELGGRYFYNVQFDWKFNIESETQVSEKSLVNINSGFGGRYKNTTDFKTGDFDGWRYYYEDGDYSTVISSIKTGNSITLKLDYLKADSQGAYITPNAEQIEVLFSLKRANGTVYHSDSKLFDIVAETPVITLTQDLIAVQNQVVELRYRHKNHNRYSAPRPFNSSTYYKDTAFTPDGAVINPNDVYTSQNAILGTSGVQSFINVPKFTPLPFLPPAGFNWTQNFDDTGLGVNGEFIGWAICNGGNGTIDMRGMTPIGAVNLANNIPVPDDGATQLDADAEANATKLYDITGESKHTLTVDEMPAHSHTVSPTASVQDGVNGLVDGAPDGGSAGTNTSSVGGGKAHNNRQRSISVVWIVRIA